MKNKTSVVCLVSLLLLGGGLASVRADETLWNLNFKDLPAGQPPKEVPFTAPCAGPQKVTTDADNTLTGSPAVGSLTTPLLFTKGSKTHYTPSLALRATAPISSGVITVNFDVLFDKVTPSADHPVETVMAFPFLDDQGGTQFLLAIVCQGPDSLLLGGVALAKGKGSSVFKAGELAHIKAVLDLNQHTFQAFLNDVPMADPEHDDKKFASFLGFSIRDGTAVGGNNGATFTAGINNIVITHG